MVINDKLKFLSVHVLLGYGGNAETNQTVSHNGFFGH